VKKVFQKVCLSLIGGLAALLIFEGSAWLLPQSWLPHRIRELVERTELYRSSDSIFVPDTELLFKIRPDTDLIINHPDYTVRVRTSLNLDGIGFRGGSLGGPVWGVAVGDSFTFGTGVNLEETWIFHLARSLRREVLNLGVPAQGPAQYTRILKQYAFPMRPRLAFYGFYFNDLDSSHRFHRSKRRLLPVSRYLRNYSVTYNLIREARISSPDRELLIKGDGVEFHFNPDALRRTLERQSRKFEERWKLTVRELSEAVKASKEANVTLIFLYFPSRWEVYWNLIKGHVHFPDSVDIDRVRTALVEYCDVQPILCFDLTGPLKGKANQGKQLYFRIDGHWNEEGNRVVAEAIREFLVAKGIAG